MSLPELLHLVLELLHAILDRADPRVRVQEVEVEGREKMTYTMVWYDDVIGLLKSRGNSRLIRRQKYSYTMSDASNTSTTSATYEGQVFTLFSQFGTLVELKAPCSLSTGINL